MILNVIAKKALKILLLVLQERIWGAISSWKASQKNPIGLIKYFSEKNYLYSVEENVIHIVKG